MSALEAIALGFGLGMFAVGIFIGAGIGYYHALTERYQRTYHRRVGRSD